MALDLETHSENDKIRKIPLQLQKLFAQLLLLDVASVSTCPLTESFGWTDNEVCIIFVYLYVQYILCLHNNNFLKQKCTIRNIDQYRHIHCAYLRTSNGFSA